MEQYIHTLLPVDSEFVPSAAQIGSFLSVLVLQFKFSLISGQRWLPGLVVSKASGELRWRTNSWTGERVSVPARDHFNLSQFEDIPGLIEGSTDYTVSQSGQWIGQDRPIDLLGTNGVPYLGNYVCTVRCERRPEVVSTSDWDGEAGPNTRNVPSFGSVCNDQSAIGIFANPWNGEVIEVANAGCARFWIEFEFGKFIYPKVSNSFDVMSPGIVLEAERCFRTKFVQGCRFW